MGYLRPVPFSRSTSWAAHKRRRPPSTEAGIDMFCDIGTPVLAIDDGRVVDVGDSIGPATGRFVTIDIDDGRRVRYLHLSRRSVKVGDRVRRGQVIAHSGATGYGEEDWSWNVAETGGAHVHMTLWPSHRYVFGAIGTLDPELYFDPSGSASSANAKPFEEDDMFTDEDRARQQRIEENQARILSALGGDLSSENQVSLFQNVQAVRDRVEGNLSSQDQITQFQNVQTIRDRVEKLSDETHS